MKTIYPSDSKGLVEIFNLYDHNYFSVYVDSQLVAGIYKESYQPTVLKRSFIKKCCELSGVTEDKLVFVSVNFEDYARSQDRKKSTDDYDCNNYLENYQAMLDFISKNDPLSSKYTGFLAQGIDDLEATI